MATAKSIKRSYKQQSIFRFAAIVGVLMLLNVVGSFFYTRLDLTADKRFTLSDSTVQLMRRVDDQVFVKVYLTGDLPAGFKRLETSTRDMLNELRSRSNGKLNYQFEDPLEGKSIDEKKKIYKEMMAKGLQPTNIQTAGSDAYSEKIVLPGATVYYKGREASVNLLLNEQGTSSQNALNNSVARLENKFASAIQNLSLGRKPKIGILRGQGELPLYKLYDIATSLGDFYEVDTLDAGRVLSIPKDYSALIVAKPTAPFDEKVKFKLDQYVMRGGSVLWLLDALRADMDSLEVKSSFMALDYGLELDDQLFTYGVRLNPTLLMDLQCNPVPLLVNYHDNQPEFRLFPCYYFPVLTPSATNPHPITKEIDAVAGTFMATLDTAVVPGVRKTILLSSSRYSRQAYTPWQVDFRTMKSAPERSGFNKSNFPVAVLLEGSFASAFKNRMPENMLRVLRDSLKTPFVEQSKPTRQIVVSDGDIIANDFSAKGQPYSLGYFKFTGENFANKNFLLNCIDYLTGQNQRIVTRSKDVKLRLLDTEKVKAEKTKWQLINVALPVLLVILFGIGYAFVRLRRYAA